MGFQGFITNGETFVYQEATSGTNSVGFGLDSNDSNVFKLKITTTLNAAPSGTCQLRIDPAASGNITFTPNGTGHLVIGNVIEGALTTSSTGVVSSVTGTAGYVLTANAPGSSPTFQAIPTGVVEIIPYVSVNHAASPYTALSTDYYISADVTGGVITIRLPNAPATGRVYIVKDQLGLAPTSNITVTTPGGAVLLDGATTYPMNTAFETIQFVFNGVNYEAF
jgi:hypothetical protein